jgi:hypothetical protein
MRVTSHFASIAVAAIAGLLGGAAIVMAMRVTTRGWWVLLPYGLLMLLLAVYFRQANILGFGRRCALAFETYSLATAVAYVYASWVNHRTVAADLGQQAWHVFLLLGIGAVGCLLLAGIAIPLRARIQTES